MYILPEYHLNTVIVHVLHVLMGRNQTLSTLSNILQCGILWSVYNIAGVVFIRKCVFDYDHAATQHSHTGPDGVQTGISYSSSSLLY
jgi:hypothetical protein